MVRCGEVVRCGEMLIEVFSTGCDFPTTASANATATSTKKTVHGFWTSVLEEDWWTTGQLHALV